MRMSGVPPSGMRRLLGGRIRRPACGGKGVTEHSQVSSSQLTLAVLRVAQRGCAFRPVAGRLGLVIYFRS